MVVERAYRNLAGYGPLEPLLADDDVWEIMVNGPDAILSQSVSTWSGPLRFPEAVTSPGLRLG
jgi:pilus assembly protein CpaF